MRVFALKTSGGTPPPPGNADECENKGLGKIGIRKLLKVNDLKIDDSAATREGREIPPPLCFAKRGRKLLKTKDSYRKKRGKRVQEAASH